MKASRFIVLTLREDPQDAAITSHRLMLRAGLIKKVGSGLYNILPMGLRSLRKVEAIIREEMNRSGAVEFVLPILTPAELWEKSGRWETMGKEMFRLKDRHDVWNVLGPTHEEAFTSMMADILKSYRDLPVNVYQMHTKFRDEIRPRFGVMRSREFIMKDAYSFDKDEEGLDKSYNLMRKTYRKIFARAGLKTVPVEADTGAIGGNASEEFMVPSEVGEDVILISEKEKYRGNQEKTPVIYKEKKSGNKKSASTSEKIHTPGTATIEDLAVFLKVEKTEILKSVLFMADENPVLVCLRGDRDVNELKLKNILQANILLPADAETFSKIGSVPGFIGPDGLKKDLKIIRDHSTESGSEWIAGANEKDYHVTGFSFKADVPLADVALAKEGDPSPEGDGVLHEIRGIEVGHIFKLGYKYSKIFNVSVLDEQGKAVTPIMGTYGIGVNRTVAAIIEQNYDEKGICWPISVAPFEICLVSITKKPEELLRIEELYEKLLSLGLDVFWDDRNERPGVKFNDAELIGFPIRLTAGKTFFEKDALEVQLRKSGEKFEVSGSTEQMALEIVKIRNKISGELEAAVELYEKEN